MEKTQVIIAGAGPVGTLAAYYLAVKGIEVILCETGPNCAIDLRASTFHPPTLEMLDQLGMAEPLIKQGLKAPEYHFRERQTGNVIEFDLGELADHTRFPYRIQCEQHVMATMLSDNLEKHRKPASDLAIESPALSNWMTELKWPSKPIVRSRKFELNI